jgi:hypothetical protein
MKRFRSKRTKNVSSAKKCRYVCYPAQQNTGHTIFIFEKVDAKPDVTESSAQMEFQCAKVQDSLKILFTPPQIINAISNH